MASTDDVRKLAAMARIDISDAEIETFSKEFESVLAYVGQIERLEATAKPDTRPSVRNVFREDGEPHESGAFIEALVEQFPDREGNSLKVKKILP